MQRKRVENTACLSLHQHDFVQSVKKIMTTKITTSSFKILDKFWAILNSKVSVYKIMLRWKITYNKNLKVSVDLVPIHNRDGR